MHITLLGRPNCHLCDEAAAVIALLRRRFDLELAVVDIDEDDRLVKEFGLRIPVILDPDGAVLDEGIVTEHSLTKALSERFEP